MTYSETWLHIKSGRGQRLCGEARMPRQVDKGSKRAPKVALSHLDESDLSDESVSD